MTDLPPDHPAVDAADRAAIRWMEDRELETDLGGTAHMLTAALPLLESATEDNLARLRDTPAGKQLLAEGWDRGVADNERGWDHVYAGHDVDPDDPLAECQTCDTPNPYRT